MPGCHAGLWGGGRTARSLAVWQGPSSVLPLPSCPSLVSFSPQAGRCVTLPQAWEGWPRPWRAEASLRAGTAGPGDPEMGGRSRETAPQGLLGSGRVLNRSRGQCAPRLDDTVLFLIIQSFQILLSYQRHKMPAHSNQKKTQVGSQHIWFQQTWARWASAESCHHCSCPLA